MAVDIVLADAARALLGRVRHERPGALSLVIGNGCCDPTAPFLCEAYVAGPGEAWVAELGIRFSLVRMPGGVVAA